MRVPLPPQRMATGSIEWRLERAERDSS